MEETQGSPPGGTPLGGSAQVLAAGGLEVKGDVRADPHRIDQPDGRQDRSAAADEGSRRSHRLADQPQGGAIAVGRRGVLVARARLGTRVEEVELEIVETPPCEAAEASPSRSAASGWVTSRTLRP